MDKQVDRHEETREMVRSEVVRTWRVFVTAVAIGIGVSIVIGSAIATVAQLIQP